MPSDIDDAGEQRLHPVSILFSFAGSLKKFALPGLLLLITGGGSMGGPDGRFGRLPPNIELWLMVLLIPAALIAVFQYLAFRLRYAGDELVIRSGFIFRNVRHVPYTRIQNLDAVQNIFHRLLGVTDVRVETGGGKEPEATISVLPMAAFHEMRRRVFERRVSAGLEGAVRLEPPFDFAQGGVGVSRTPDATGVAPNATAGAPARTLLHLDLRDLLLFGFLENRGLVVIGAVYGVLWEIGFLDGFWGGLFDEESYGRGIVRDVLTTLGNRRLLSLAQAGVLVSGVIGLLLFVRAVSMGWAVVRLFGFRLLRIGEDLRTDYGLLTKVSATIPLRRIQTITIREGPLFRLLKRVSVRVETAGGGGASQNSAAASGREWLAPLLRTAALPALVNEVLPELHLAGLQWQPATARAFRRAVKPRLAAAVGLSIGAAFVLRWWAAPLATCLIAWSVLAAWQYVRHLGWAETTEVIAFRSGWLWRSVTVARVAKIQSVALIETPFDRRAAMARVRVDTAGASERSHRVEIPYLPRDLAASLQLRLAAAAAATEFRW
jgi:putative membrane protein